METGQSSLFELSLDHESIDHLTETARWGKFLAIVGFVLCGLFAVLSFFLGSLIASTAIWQPTPGAGAAAAALGAISGIFITVVYLIFSAVYFFPCLFLYHYSVRMKAALRTNDQVKLNQSLKSQKLLYRYVGIVTIVGMAMEVIGLLIFGMMALLIHR